VGELRAVRGMTPALQARLAPWLCALPEVGTSPVALASLRAGQGRLLAMFAPEVPLARAEQLIGQRGRPRRPSRLRTGRGGDAGSLAARADRGAHRWPRAGRGRADRWGQDRPKIVARAWGEAADR
jgi:general secretion pathway protein K